MSSSSSSSSSSKDKKDTTPTRATTREGDIIIMGKSLATTGRVLLALPLRGRAQIPRVDQSSSTSDVQLLEQLLAPRSAEARAAMSASVSSMFPSQFDEEKIMEGLLAIDDATVAMIGTVIELLGAVLLMFTYLGK